MSNKKKLVISIFSLLLCIVVTFAWINELQNPRGRVMALRFTNAEIASSELAVKLSVNITEDEFEDITSLRSEVSEPDLEAYDNFAPGCRQKFKVDITNLSTSPVTLRIILSDIVCEEGELRDSIIIGTNGFFGFNSNYPAPEVQNKRLSDGMDESSGFVLVENVEIPPDNADSPVSIYFYFMFAASGTENLEDKSFSVGTINFLTI